MISDSDFAKRVLDKLDELGKMQPTLENMDKKLDKVVGEQEAHERRLDKLEQKDAAMDEWRAGVDKDVTRLMNVTFFKKAAVGAVGAGSLAGIISGIVHLVQALL